MATEKELEKQLRQIKKEVRELRTHNQFLLDRLEKGHERNAELRKQIMTMTIDDVIKIQKELSEYQEKVAKDKELLETFDKQIEVKLATQSEKINKLDKEVAVIKKDIEIIKTNHLVHLDQKLRSVEKVLWTVGILVFSNLIILLRDIIL